MQFRKVADRYNEWIDRHDVAWELTMAALAIAFVVVGLLNTGTITSILISTESAQVSVPKKIRQLDQLRQDQLLTAAQFEAKRDELLARM